MLRKFIINRRLKKTMKPNPDYWRRWFAHIPAERQAKCRERYQRVLAELV